MAKQQIEKPSPEETAPDEETTEAAGPKYEKYPKDPAQWTPEHDRKVFADVSKIVARAPYSAMCRMFPYLQGLIAPDHQAERERIDRLENGREVLLKEQAARAYANNAPVQAIGRLY